MSDKSDFERFWKSKPHLKAYEPMAAAWQAWQAARQAPASGEVEPVVAYRYRVIDHPQGWEYSSTPLFGPESGPGSREEYQALTLDQLLSELNDTHPPAKVPEGWKLVPIEPTAEMSKAGVKVLQNTNAWATGVYQAMVEAARPTPAATAETDWVKPTGRHHELKTDYSVFQQSAAGLKPWEIRKNDRGFSVGDTVTLRETEYTGEEMADGAPLAFTGRTVSGVIGYVLDGPVYGLSDKWCIFTLQSTTGAVSNE